MNALPLTIEFTLPEWIARFVAENHGLTSDHDKMAFTISLAQQNISEGTGGPFGAAIFHKITGELLSAGVNLVVSNGNSMLHAEVVAIMLAEKALHSFSIPDDYELFASCEPCAMCLGASLWSGVKRIICGARGEDARGVGFDEGPVFPQSWEYLENLGIEVVHDVMREESIHVLQSYAEHGGEIYNAS